MPWLEEAGYEVTGIGPEAPQGPSCRQAGSGQGDIPGRAGVIVACTSSRHVADLPQVPGLTHAALAPGGTVVAEWARERSCEATARWCSGRLPGPGRDRGWLHRRHAGWREPG